MREIVLLNLLGKLAMNDEISNLKKIEWVHWFLNEVSQGTTMNNNEIEQAIGFVEDIRELFMWDMK